MFSQVNTQKFLVQTGSHFDGGIVTLVFSCKIFLQQCSHEVARYL